MTKLQIIGAGLLSIALAGPALAASDGSYRMHRIGHKHDVRVLHRMPVQGFGMTSPVYSPWRSYGDPNFLRDPDDDLTLPPSANGG
jgi:hypothetical protein